MEDTTIKVYIVTGATAASGQAQAYAFVRRGDAVVLADPDRAACMALAGALGTRAAYASGDVATEQGWREVFRTAVDLFGRVDGVVNDGSIYDADPSEA